jgi:hypothetical protein
MIVSSTSADEHRETAKLDLPDESTFPDEALSRPVRRYRAVASGAIAVALVPYLWVLWDLWSGTLDPLRSDEAAGVPGSVIYDVQARALLHGHFSLPRGSIGIEAFIHGGRTYTYFGIFPSLIRMPVLALTHAFDGRLSGLSILLAWVVTAGFAALLLWRVRVMVRGDTALGWSEALSYGVLLFSVLVGSALLSLASMPNVYTEDEAWGVALTGGSLFALLGVAERPSWRRVLLSGLMVLLTNLNRGTTGYACILATFLVAGWFALGRAGPDRRRWAGPVALAGLVATAAGCIIDFAKFHVLFGFPSREQLLYRAYGFGHINGGHHFSLNFLPSTLEAYLSPLNLRITSVFPYLGLRGLPVPLVAHTPLFNRGGTASLSASMPLLVLLAVWGVITTFGRHRPLPTRSFRALLVASAASGAAMLIYGTIYERFLADFLPFLILAATVGMVDLWRRMDGHTRSVRTLAGGMVGALALFGFVANVGIAVTPLDSWTQTQADHYVQVTQDFSRVTGDPLVGHVVQGNSLPIKAPIGELFVMGHCRALYISDGDGPAFPYPHYIWRPVEVAPHTPLCRALLAERGPAAST